jgi:hypothetical protein
MSSYNTYKEAITSAEHGRSFNSCPWYNAQDYRIVLNDPKNCLQKPTGYEMVSSTYAREGSGDLDDLLEELLNDSSLTGGNAGAKQQWMQVQKEIKDILAKQTPESTDLDNNSFSAPKVGVRGLAGKIQSGEYDPKGSNDSKNNHAGDGDNSKTAHSGSGGTDNQERYAIFWIRSGTFTYGSPQIYIKLNGQYISVRPGSGKVLQGAMSGAPGCGAQDNCDGSGWCGNIIRVKLTQAQNSWVAEEQHADGQLRGHTQVWRGSFTAQPGCNLIEIK